MNKQNQKQCTSCNKIKNILEFSKRKASVDGLKYECKACSKQRMNTFRKTKNGLITIIYSGQKRNSIVRGHNQPTYTKKELKEWLFSQKKFHILFDNWKRLDYQKDYVPSVDRKDDYIGYTMDNIQLMTWKENNAKHHADKKHGRNNKANRAVIQTTLSFEFIAEYHSAREADRATGINQSTICKACLGKSNTAGGYLWSFA